MDGELKSTQQAIVQEWIKFTEQLGKDTMHSQDRKNWERIIFKEDTRTRGSKDEGDVFSESQLQGIFNCPPTWGEVFEEIKKLSIGKAEGPNGISGEFLRATLSAEEIINEMGVSVMPEVTGHSPKPNNHLGKVLMVLINRIWEEGKIPDILSEADVVYILQKGEASCMDSYRQITIIEPVIKLVSGIVVVRLRKYVEGRNLLGREQAGFRQGEECAAHYAALLEIASRRMNNILPTYIAFLDIKKAFPSVPHECLFLKLEHLGIRGKLMKLLRALFACSSFRIRLGTLYSNIGRIEKGIKQGDPISPDLFELFFQDIVKIGYDLGIYMEGVEGEIAFLLYADDTVIISQDRNKVEIMLQGAQDWITKHEMKFNTKKSAIMLIQGRNGNADLVKDMKENPFKLGVEDIPMVEEYKYLGYNFNVSLKNTHIIKAREEAGRKMFAKIYPFITNREIPVHAKLSVIRSYLIPVISYGGEFFGLESTQTMNCLENILIDALRGVAMGSIGKAGAGFNLLKEFNFHPITVIAAIARIRLFNKITKGRFKTVIGSLFIGNATNHMGNWGIKTRSWIAKKESPSVDGRYK